MVRAPVPGKQRHPELAGPVVHQVDQLLGRQVPGPGQPGQGRPGRPGQALRSGHGAPQARGDHLERHLEAPVGDPGHPAAQRRRGGHMLFDHEDDAVRQLRRRAAGALHQPQKSALIRVAPGVGQAHAPDLVRVCGQVKVELVRGPRRGRRDERVHGGADLGDRVVLLQVAAVALLRRARPRGHARALLRALRRRGEVQLRRELGPLGDLGALFVAELLLEGELAVAPKLQVEGAAPPLGQETRPRRAALLGDLEPPLPRELEQIPFAPTRSDPLGDLASGLAKRVPDSIAPDGLAPPRGWARKEAAVGLGAELEVDVVHEDRAERGEGDPGVIRPRPVDGDRPVHVARTLFEAEAVDQALPRRELPAWVGRGRAAWPGARLVLATHHARARARAQHQRGQAAPVTPHAPHAPHAPCASISCFTVFSPSPCSSIVLAA